MPKRPAAKGIYQRGPYWLDWDRKADGALRSPNLAIFWYDPARGRQRSTSTGTADHGAGKLALDRHYLERESGVACCPTCHRPWAEQASGFLLADAIADYQLAQGEKRGSAVSIRARLNHVVDYLLTLRDSAVSCDMVDEAWIERFRAWLLARPIVSPSGDQRPRSPSTVENSILQLAAVVNAAHKRGDILRPAQFRPIAAKDVNRTPQHRAGIEQLAAMFRYAIDPRFPVKRARLHRFLLISVATLARPDAAHDVSTDPKRGQWNSDRRVLALNPRGRRQTKKYRAIVRVPWQVARWLDADLEAGGAWFVPVKSVRSAWDSMAIDLKLPNDGEAGMKLLRRSMAQLVRERGGSAEEVEMQLGHRKIDSVTELYAPFQPDYLAGSTAAIEAIIDEIEALVPGAFYRSGTGPDASVVPIGVAKRAAKSLT